MDRHLLVNVRETIQNFPEESPQPVLVLVQAVIDGVPQSAFFTVFHLSGHRDHDWDGKQAARQTSSGEKEVLHHIFLEALYLNTFSRYQYLGQLFFSDAPNISTQISVLLWETNVYFHTN